MPSLFLLYMQCSTWKSRFVPLKCVPAARNLRTSSSFIYRTSENCRHHENFPLSYGDRGQCHIDPSLGSTEVQKDSTYITWSSSVRKICLSYLIYFSVTYISVYISYTLGHNSVLYYLFHCWNYHGIGHWELSSWFLCPSDILSFGF